MIAPGGQHHTLLYRFETPLPLYAPLQNVCDSCHGAIMNDAIVNDTILWAGPKPFPSKKHYRAPTHGGSIEVSPGTQIES